ncbi:Nucleolar protein 12 [Wickerhamiella sorbophila]|uniref:Nucleolar protein 12 n=1 Tax=Wickerhamiella sorbophila TaxID=45607 RepID=A0A2T0FIC6_9ASCO|nr:Nucleolar protein 12 [Wickerhamiella sorbophila]PRT54707.1 Nucleolar protein 12 [Wickerhamiella sorbophila]
MGLFSADHKGENLPSIFQNATRKEVLDTLNNAIGSAEQTEPSENEGVSDSDDAGADEIVNNEANESSPDPEPHKAGKAKAAEDDNLEEKYFRKLIGEEDAPSKTAEPSTSKSKSDKPRRADQQDEKEKQENTVFVGNVSSRVVSDKQVAKQFKQLFTKVGPVASVRFRSIALSEQLPRRAAYIKQKVHEKRDSVNAYVVFKKQESAVEACKLNGEVFDDHHIRVDHLANPAEHNRKRSVFVGNLDFEATEESLYRHFMDCGSIEYVRIVRDNKTNVGKGFAYVQFKDSAAIPAALMMNERELGGRKLRVTHSKQHTSKPTPATKAPPRKKRAAKKVHINPNEVLEGSRAKTGDKIGLGRKRKARSGTDYAPATRKRVKGSNKK